MENVTLKGRWDFSWLMAFFETEYLFGLKKRG